jgi:hypothetical protein
VPDLERIARDLNAVVRRQYLAVREQEKGFRSEAVAERRGHLMKPLHVGVPAQSGKVGVNGSRLNYAIADALTNSLSFYVPSLIRDHLKVVLNQLERRLARLSHLSANVTGKVFVFSRGDRKVCTTFSVGCRLR